MRFEHQAKLLKKTRLKKGITQHQIGEYVWGDKYLGSQFVSRIERGKERVPVFRVKSYGEIIGLTVEEMTRAYLKDEKELYTILAKKGDKSVSKRSIKRGETNTAS